MLNSHWLDLECREKQLSNMLEWRGFFQIYFKANFVWVKINLIKKKLMGVKFKIVINIFCKAAFVTFIKKFRQWRTDWMFPLLPPIPFSRPMFRFTFPFWTVRYYFPFNCIFPFLTIKYTHTHKTRKNINHKTSNKDENILTYNTRRKIQEGDIILWLNISHDVLIKELEDQGDAVGKN